MLLQITTTHQPARDLGFLVGKHPDRLQTFPLSQGEAHVFYPEATDERTTVALLMELDPIHLVRGAEWGGTGALAQYVNDRPYVTSSYFSVAIRSVFREALNGASRDRQELADTAIPLEVRVDVVSTRSAKAVHDYFEPLGWDVVTETFPLDPEFPGWGEARAVSMELSGTARLSDLLSHLYVLLPALDGGKHYFIDEAEVEKLLRHAEDWLPSHPHREQISRAYLERRGHLVSQAEMELSRRVRPLDDASQLVEQDVEETEHVDKPIRLHHVRLQRVRELLEATGVRSVVDLGCGEGKLLGELAGCRQLERIVGVDVTVKRLRYAAKRLKLDMLDDAERARFQLFQGSLLYADERLAQIEAAVLVEVIEHIEPVHLPTVVEVLFGTTRPKHVVMTTPNAEYNELFEDLPAGKFRHRDHRFEWTREEFRDFCESAAATHGYRATFESIGTEHAEHGAPSQLAHFVRDDSGSTQEEG